jgi:hypothetical protein
LTVALHARRGDFGVEADANGNRTVTYARSIEPRSVVIPIDLLRSDVARQGARVSVTVGTFDERAYGTAISLGAEMMGIVLDD